MMEGKAGIQKAAVPVSGAWGEDRVLAKSRSPRNGVVVLILLALTIISCSTVAKHDSKSIVGPMASRIMDGRTGRDIDFSTLIDRLTTARVVFLGERHEMVEDHRMEQRILISLAQRGPMTVAMEMLPRTVQTGLDAWTEGRLKEKAFLRSVAWEKNWGYPFRFYRPIFLWAREHRVRIWGLNAPPDVVRKIAKKGLSSLTPYERSKIAEEINESNRAHRAYIRKVYLSHEKKGIDSFDSFYQAQLAWEETMAETLAELIRRDGDRKRFVVLVGRGHLEYFFGVPNRLERRVKVPILTVIPVDASEGKKRGIVQEPLADFLWITTTRSPAPTHGSRLGLRIRWEKDGGPVIEAVIGGSPAAKAGLRPGDRIVELNGVAVRSFGDFHKAVAGNGATLVFGVLRSSASGSIQHLEVPVPYPSEMRNNP